jgi:hypothetical protein
MNFDQGTNNMDINRNANGPLFKRNISFNENNNPQQNQGVYEQPNLNMVHGSQVPDIGLDLIMNKSSKPRRINSFDGSNQSPRSEDQHSNLFESDDNNSGYSSDNVSMNQGQKPNKSYFVNNNDDNESSDDDNSERVGPQMNYNSAPRYGGNYQQPQFKPVSEEDLLNEKKELLYQFDRLEKRGIRIPKRYSINSDLEEMKADFDKLKREKETDASINFQRKMLMAFVSGTEYLNTKFDPFSVKLTGWSEEVHNDVQNYDDIFEELHEKYKGKANMSPELRLLFSLGGSAFMFHLTNSMFSQTNIPGLGDVLKNNPQLAKSFANAALNQMGAEGNTQAASFMNFNNMQQGQAQAQYQAQQSRGMKGPSNIDDILHEIENNDLDEKMEDMSILGSDTSDDSSLNDLLTKKKNRKGKKRSLNI